MPDPAELVAEDVAEQRAHEALLARDARRQKTPAPVDHLLRTLRGRVGADTRWTLMAVGRQDFQITTEDGDSGYGDTPAAAVRDLLERLG